jgi:signal transduction histidine kinase
MTLAQAGYAAVFAAATVACLAGLVRVRRVPDADIRRGLAWLLGLSAVWGCLEMIRLLVASARLQTVFYIAALAVGFSTVFAWLYFTSAYAGLTLHRDTQLQYAAVTTYVTVALMKVTNPLHGEYFVARQVAEPFPHLAIQQAPVHWAVVGLAYTGASAGFYMLYDTFESSQQDTWPLTMLAVAAMVPIAANLVAVTVPTVPELSFEAVGVAIFAVGTLFFVEEDFLRARVTAQRTLLSEHPDPCISVGHDGRLLDYNDEAAGLFDRLEERVDLATTAPRLAEVVATDAPRFAHDGRAFAVLQREVSTGTDRTATAVVLQEVTEAEQRRREIERQNERLSDIAAAVGHNLRNASNVLQGYLEVAAEDRVRKPVAADADTTAEPLAVAARTAQRVDTVAEELRLLAELGQTVQPTGSVLLEETTRAAWGALDTGDATVECADLRMAADSRRLEYLLQAVFRFHVANQATTVRVEPVRSEPVAESGPVTAVTAAPKPGATDGAGADGFAVVGDGDPVTDEDMTALLQFNAESRIDVPGLGPAFARALAEAHGWTVEADAEGARLVFLTGTAETTVPI